MGDFGKVAWTIGIIVAVVFAYLIMAAVMPAFNELVAVADTEMTTSHNMTSYPGTRELILSSPWWIWFVPLVVGGVSVMVILKRPRE
ncbi:MAG: hypothetical protein HYX90_01115 [Chloroflexi bacterium]|nr:hypothetical protein [Chloroflexota bacterium]